MLTITNKWWRRAILASLFILAAAAWLQFAIEASFVPASAEICQKNEYTGQKECATYQTHHFVIFHIFKFFDAVVVTAIATVILAIFTARLWWSTDKLQSITSDLHEMAQTQERTFRKQERAYLVGGGPYGAPRFELNPRQVHQAKHFPVSGHFTDRKRMTIQNYGKTPAFVTSIEWGFSKETRLFERVRVSVILEVDDLREWFEVRKVEHPHDVYTTTGRGTVSTRHVEFSRKERDGQIFFGRIRYKDVFKEEHYSTFALLLGPDHSDSVGRSYADDWD
jgi:hypothetical protein